MSSITNFKTLQVAEQKAEDKIAANFLIKGDLATTIKVNGKDMQVALSYQNKEEFDRVYTYTAQSDTLTIGTNYEWEGRTYLVTDQDKLVKNVLYNKYLALECNFQINGFWGWFKKPNYMNTQIKEDTTIISLAKPIAILPSNSLKTGDKLNINGRPWLIIEYDDFSTLGITYYSLEATTEAKTVSTISAPTIDPNLIIVHGLDVIQLTTEDGYFTTDDTRLKVKRTLTTVQFTVPFGVSDFSVEVKEAGVIVNKKYRVVL